MTEQEARKLAESIKEQFPHVQTIVLQAGDMRNAPRNWFIAIYRSLAEPRGLHIHNTFEWQDALDAVYVLAK